MWLWIFKQMCKNSHTDTNVFSIKIFAGANSFFYLKTILRLLGFPSQPVVFLFFVFQSFEYTFYVLFSGAPLFLMIELRF